MATDSTRGVHWAAVLFGVGLVVASCRSAGTPPLSAELLADARSRLEGPLAGDMASLYRLRVPSSGGLRLSILTHAGDGRMTVSEPFGSAMSMTAWSGAESPTLYDYREGCRLEAVDLSAAVGVGTLPMPQAVRLLAGRLPALPADRVSETEDGRLLVVGSGWRVSVSVRPDPWRVVAVDELLPQGGSGWRLRLDDHSSSVPGFIRVDDAGGRWAELELVRLEWKTSAVLPALPGLPRCGDSAKPRE